MDDTPAREPETQIHRPQLHIADFHERQTTELIRLWRASFEHGVGVRDPHSLQDQEQFFRSEVLSAFRVRVATLEDGTMAAFMASDARTINQLYVRVDQHARGIGTALLRLAQQDCEGELSLFTFARNGGARRFYERHGFRPVAFGFEPHWQLDDVQYRWARQPD